MAIEPSRTAHLTPPIASASGPEVAPALRRRLQTWYAHGQEKAQAGSFDYATDLFQQCVEGDPSSVDFVQAFLHNLHRRYGNNRKGASFAAIKGASTRAGLKKAAMKKDWPSILKHGLELLKLNPWDAGVLVQVAHACDALNCLEAELGWLRAALDVDPKDPDVNRECAIALGKQGDFDQSIACWARVEKARPNNEEAQRAISQMQVRKTEAQYVQRQADKAALLAAEDANEGPGRTAMKFTRQQVLQQEINSNPANLDAYIELAELHAREDRYQEAERILRAGLDASGGDLKIREQLEDMGLRRARQQVAIAERRAEGDGSEQAIDLYRRMLAELNQLEVEVFRSRVERYPHVTTWKIELGIRLKRAGNFNEAIKALQEARNDPRRLGTVLLELGECFQQIKQYRLAMNNYQGAIEAIAERDLEQRKKALYRAGVLSMGLEDVDGAEKYLQDLAALDFGYRDVAERLDKIAQVRDKG